MLFKTIVQPKVDVDELVIIKLMEGTRVAGIVDKIDKDYIWLRASKDKNSHVEKFNLKVDQVIKMN